MLFTGSYPRSLDDKQRLALPRKHREELNDHKQVVLAPGTEGCVAVYPTEVFAQMADRLAKHAPSGRDVRSFSRLFYAQAETAEIDSQGRIRVPAELAKLGDLREEVMVVGVRDHLELWNRGRWEQFLAQEQARYDQLAETALAWRTNTPPSDNLSSDHA
jgi:MraZ protein